MLKITIEDVHSDRTTLLDVIEIHDAGETAEHLIPSGTPSLIESVRDFVVKHLPQGGSPKGKDGSIIGYPTGMGHMMLLFFALRILQNISSGREDTLAVGHIERQDGGGPQTGNLH